MLRGAAGVVGLGVAGAQAAPALAATAATQVLGLSELSAATGTVAAPAMVEGDAAALVLFTSGTTGTPKAIPLTTSMLRERVLLYSPEVDEAPLVTLACTPLAHVGGVMPILNSLAKGSTVVVQQRFEPGRWLELVEIHRVTNTFVVPTMLHRIVGHASLEQRDLSSMQLLVFGAAPASPDLIRRVQAAFPGAVVANTFGQTETMGSLTLFDPSDQRPERLASVGQPMPGVEARVVDPETGQDRAAGEVGELWVKTPTMVIPAEQKADPLLPEGWFRTGDLVSQDEEGYLYPMGRRADTINRAGEKFPPSEIEDVVRLHPAVVDAAVVGLPDDEMGMRVGVAAVVSRPLELEELRRFCEGELAHFKLPERLLVLGELPYNDFGKVDRKAIRALAEIS